MKSLDQLKQALENTNEAIQFFEDEIQRHYYILQVCNEKECLMVDNILVYQKRYNNMLDILDSLYKDRLGLLYQINYYDKIGDNII